MKRALVTGVSGQDGYYLTRLLLGEGYVVHGTVRTGAADRPVPAADLAAERPEWHGRVTLHPLELSDAAGTAEVLRRSEPDEVYHLAGQTQVGRSVEEPVYTAEVTAMATLRLLEEIRRSGRPIRFFHAGSSEMFGEVDASPQDERTPMRPANPYAVSKLFGHGMVHTYRKQHGLFACSGILYNHESPLRGTGFVTRQLAQAAAAARAGARAPVSLRSLDARRDWGFAGDYVEGFHRMLQADAPADFVLATGRTHSVREFAERAFARVGLDYREFVVGREPVSPGPELCGRATRAAERLGWRPRVAFDELVDMMVDAECRRLDALA